MEGSSGFQGSMQPNYHLQYQHLNQPVSQHQQFHDEHLSKILTSEKLEEWTKVLENEIHGHHLTWTDEMARLMITAISYITEAALSEPDADANAIGKKLLQMPKMEKWKIISMAMGERGYNATPRQCEVKFNDINRRYKQLIGLLGRPTSCKIVENPGLLDLMDIGEREKEVVRKLLGSEQFLYRELCSLYHQNRLFLPHDWELRRSVMSILVGNCGEEHKDEGLTQSEKSTRINVSDEHKVLRARLLRLEEEKVEIQQKKVELEKERLEWLCSNKNEDVKLQKMRLENENLRLKNARLAFELKRGCIDGANK